MGKIKKLPALYHKTKTGKIEVVKIWSDGDTVYSEFGHVDGKMQTSSYVCTPKNVGRSNATTAQEQAILEAKSKWQNKRDRKYVESIDDAETKKLPQPMLAKKFKDRKSKIVYPVTVQRKLNGLRSLAKKHHNKVDLISRSGKFWTVPTHIQNEVNILLANGETIDGELYIHGVPLQQLNSFVKKQHPRTHEVQLHIYDYANESLTWKEREQKLKELKLLIEKNRLNSLIVCNSFEAFSEEEVLGYEKQFIEDGYEGAIVRLPEGKYIYGYRSSDLLKVKTFEDAEFTILNAYEGKGKDVGTPTWVLQNDLADNTFDARMAGTYEERTNYWKNRKDYFGKKVTVKFLGRSDLLIPLNATAMHFRLEEDLDEH